MSAGMELILDAQAVLGLNDRQRVEDWIREACRLADMHIIGMQSHVLPNGHDNGPGITAVAVIAESHVAVHTFPEKGAVSMNLYSCRPFDSHLVLESFERWFGVSRVLYCTTLTRSLECLHAETHPVAPAA
mgnify:CR=1 FL=1